MKIKKWLLLGTVFLLLFITVGAGGVVWLNYYGARDGSASPQCNVGSFYENGWGPFKFYDNGWGPFKNEEKATYWYRRSAEQGYLRCQYNLARMLAKKEEYTEAFTWFMKAAMQNDPWSQYAVGRMYDEGKGAPHDAKAAANWMARAAAQGLPQAQVYLAIMYAKGEGVPYDLEQAAMWARKAAEHGDSNAADLLKSINTYRSKITPGKDG